MRQVPSADRSLPSAIERRPPEVSLSEEDWRALKHAVQALEAPSFVTRLSKLAGRPIELLGQALPQPVSEAVSKATQAALTRALRYALRTIPGPRADDRETRVHQALTALSGAMGGALGISAVLVELPISTTIMLRAIARIAQAEGEDLESPETALACLQVFALGGRSSSQHLHESGYFAVRAAMARSVTRAVQMMAGRGGHRRKRVSHCPPLEPDRSSLRTSRVAKDRCTGRADLRCGERSSRQHALHASFPDAGPRAFYCPPAGAHVRQRHGSPSIRPDQS